MNEEIYGAIMAAVDEVNAILPTDMRLSKDADAVIFGRGGKLDSLGLVNFVMAVEDRLSAQGWNVSLTDARAMSQSQSPFRSIQALSAFIVESIREQATA